MATPAFTKASPMEEQSLQPNITLQAGKKPRRNHLTGRRPPPAFWDNLSKVWLTKSAWWELDRRISCDARRSNLRGQGLGRPITPDAVAAWSQQIRSAAEVLAGCSSEDLKGIKLSARHGGPDLRDLQGYREPVKLLQRAMGSRQPSLQEPARGSRSATTTKNTTESLESRTSRPYDRNFQQDLVDGAVYPNRYEHPDGRRAAKPDNWDEIRQRMRQARPSLSPSQFSDEKIEDFLDTDENALLKMHVRSFVVPIIEGNVGLGRCVASRIPFTNLDRLTNATLAHGRPDRYYGARPEHLDPRLRTELSNLVVPSSDEALPIAPNFFLALKGPDGSAAAARTQAGYHGALGARAMQSLHSYAQGEPVFDNNAYTISSSYSGGTLKMYTCHLTQPVRPGGPPEYYQTQLMAVALTDDAEAFRKGAAAYRNARDWAKEQRDRAIQRANERAEASEAAERPFGDPSKLDQAAILALELPPDEVPADVRRRSNAAPPPQESETFTDEKTAAPGRSAERSIHPKSPRRTQQRKQRQEAGAAKRARRAHKARTRASRLSPAVCATGGEVEEKSTCSVQ